MKTIGLIGGMSWESTQSYYRIINTMIKKELGGLHSARCILYSVDFAEIAGLQSQGNWKKCAEIMSNAAKSLEQAGADFCLICTNTMHKVFEEVQSHLSIPLLHIVDATAKEALSRKITTIGLLGTSYTMDQAFYKDRLSQSGLTVITPDTEQRAEISRIIFEELCLGKMTAQARDCYCRVIASLKEKGAQGIVLGCTEIGLLISSEHVDIPLFDTAEIHAQYAATYALS